jgi:putative PIN family toxin of toxin-antitoxin system
VTLDVTADSNIYISALVFGGRPLQFLNAARAGIFPLALSQALTDEVHRVLHDKFRWPPDDLVLAATELARFTVRVNPTETISAIPEDPDDNRVLECAVAAGSRYIVTGDADLLRLKRYRDIQIVRVAEFMGFIEF